MHVNETLQKELAEMYLVQNLSMTEIAEKTGIKKWTVQRILYDGGYQKPKNKQHKKVKKQNPEFEFIDNNYVIYKDSIYELLTKERAVSLLMRKQRMNESMKVAN